MVSTNICWVAVEAFAHLEDTSGLAVLRPEGLGDFWNCVNSDTIEFVSLDNTFDPVLERFSNPRVVLVEIRKSCESAVLNRILVAPVNIAVLVVVLSLVIRVDL